jgi:hypothetical protein
LPRANAKMICETLQSEAELIRRHQS